MHKTPKTVLARAFLFCCQIFHFTIHRGFFCFVTIFVLPWLFHFASAFLFCHDLFVFFSSCRRIFVLLQVLYFTVPFLFSRGFFILPWFLLYRGILYYRGFFVLLWLFYFAVTLMGYRRFETKQLYFNKCSQTNTYYTTTKEHFGKKNPGLY